MRSRYREVRWIESLVLKARKYATVKVLDEVEVSGRKLPIWSFKFGSDNPEDPCFAIFAGVHGLEKIGTHLATYFLRSIVTRLSWDEDLHRQLERARLFFVPLINPGGMSMNRRSNPSGVDLMRNAPVEAETPPPFLVGGHRYGAHLPWYRGAADQPMEREAQAVFDFCHREIFPSRVALSLDIHSGFGMRDRLWYPYAKTTGEFPRRREALRLARLLKKANPYHVYIVEPQSRSYTTHGDLWDYIFDSHLSLNGDEKIYLPWTLEMGSWLWVRKNPRQLFSLLGGFNPVLPHRYRRTMRRHSPLLDFLFKATLNTKAWI